MVTKTKSIVEADDKWIIKGISIELRDSVTQAAKEEGITVGEYVDRAIHNFHSKAKTAVNIAKIHDINDVVNALIVIERRLGHLENTPKKQATHKKPGISTLVDKEQVKGWLAKGNEVFKSVYDYTKKKISRSK